MKDSRITELTEYFTRLGLEYGGNRRTWARNGADWLNGRYRGVTLHVSAERAGDGKANTGNDNVNNNAMYRPLYRNHLQVAVETGRPVRQPVIVLPRNEFALVEKHGYPVVNGKVITAGGTSVVGADLRHSWYIAVGRLLDTGVPEFDAVFGVLCEDESYARTVLRPDLLRWIAGDARSRGARILFNNDRVELFLRTERLQEPPELFVPEWIFPAADYLVELIARAG